MKQLSQTENAKITRVLENDPELFMYFKEQINSHPVQYHESYGKEFDQEFYENYLQEKLEKVLIENADKLKEVLEKKTINQEDVMKAFEESGSLGLTLLIEDMIKKFEQEDVVSQELIDTLVSIIHARNELRELEYEFINEEYLEYLTHRYQSLNQ